MARVKYTGEPDGDHPDGMANPDPNAHPLDKWVAKDKSGPRVPSKTVRPFQPGQDPPRYASIKELVDDALPSRPAEGPRRNQDLGQSSLGPSPQKKKKKARDGKKKVPEPGPAGLSDAVADEDVQESFADPDADEPGYVGNGKEPVRDAHSNNFKLAESKDKVAVAHPKEKGDTGERKAAQSAVPPQNEDAENEDTIVVAKPASKQQALSGRKTDNTAQGEDTVMADAKDEEDDTSSELTELETEAEDDDQEEDIQPAQATASRKKSKSRKTPRYTDDPPRVVTAQHPIPLLMDNHMAPYHGTKHIPRAIAELRNEVIKDFIDNRGRIRKTLINKTHKALFQSDGRLTEGNSMVEFYMDLRLFTQDVWDKLTLEYRRMKNGPTKRHIRYYARFESKKYGRDLAGQVVQHGAKPPAWDYADALPIDVNETLRPILDAEVVDPDKRTTRKSAKPSTGKKRK